VLEIVGRNLAKRESEKSNVGVARPRPISQQWLALGGAPFIKSSRLELKALDWCPVQCVNSIVRDSRSQQFSSCFGRAQTSSSMLHKALPKTAKLPARLTREVGLTFQ
jgi:hypothetical protein